MKINNDDLMIYLLGIIIIQVTIIAGIVLAVIIG